MNKHFFSHLVEVSSLEIEIDSLSLEESEKAELKSLIHENIYHKVLDAVLSELTEDDKKVFLSHLLGEEHDKIWELVNDKVENIEEKIKNAAEDIKQELYNDISATKDGK